MAATDYRCQNKEDDLAKIPLIAHKIIVAQHEQKEKRLTIALVVTIIVSVVTHLVLH